MTTPAQRVSAYRIAGPAILLIAGVVATVVALIYGGAAEAPRLLDPGPVVRWGLPLAKMLTNVTAAVMLGSLVLALFALKVGTRPFERAMDAASAGAAAFTVASGISAFLTFMSAFNPTLSADRLFGEQLGDFLLNTALGQSWLITTLMGATVTVLAFAWRTWTPVLLTAILAAASFLPLATQGHSGDVAGHNIAVNSILLHTVGAAVWLGGLLLVVLLRRTPELEVTSLVQRYSTLALAAFVVVTVSGLARSIVALGGWSGLLTPYGGILVAKIVLLVAMGALGAWYRSRLIPKLDRDRRWFWMLVLCEVALMGLASGAAAALARTEPPAGDTPPAVRTPAEILTDSPLPPELTFDRWFTEWNVDVLWLVAAGFGLVFYLAGMLRLRRRGDRWPIHRTVFWVLGLLLLVWVTSGALNAYQDYLFSVHMMGHMLLSMAIPLLLVSGAPITLALRAIEKRDDGTRGGREWIMWAVHSPFARVVTHPFVAAGIFVGSLWAFYFTDLFRWSMYEHLGHEWMVAHFLISGYLFVMSLIGADPVPYRLPYPGRLITLIAVMALHAFFGIAIMMQTGLMVSEWFGAMGRTWGPTPLEDQYIGGGIAWSVGEIPTLILAITVAIQWSRNDSKVQRRRDRHADRTGEAELEEYNARLAELAAKDARAAARERR
ncbi:bifunctional copper resistance protein CopD/cytochrome c oxidase assembly protein [Microbacterium sp. M28]|uniref:bifunctional copper resistance protein CopD/cytochrome c oxidase assembly protein n=1 Tax=Microbacterium sp. M28 TaxID=2962064 RepID=UPI0021F3F607|nr:bifunctional copper resistance protein CopD/cytochrome c oxidase assembly protein [Microbacterium sp. M28]UYO97228.1 bifunctional copper resistance protein CopD/cytochrome c oxidase assembly protein [Microbacterium sp. M28]